jgi:hypothetical protein
MFPIAGAFSALAAAIAVLAGRNSRTQAAIAADPPRSDYSTTTRPYYGRFKRDAFPIETEIDRRLLDTSSSLVEVNGLQAAMLRSFERAFGARKARNDQWVQIRINECRGLAHASSSALVEFAGHARRSHEVLGDAANVGPPELGRGGTLDEVLTEHDLAVLYRAGIRIEELERLGPNASGRGRSGLRLPERLLEAADESESLANALVEWDPLRDLARPPEFYE